ncbi:MAG: IS200/IS605 family transposase [Pirellulaceae bacterium]
MGCHQQLLYHLVFSTKERRRLLTDDNFRDAVWAYMAGVCNNLDGHAIRVGGYFDHAHLLVRIPAKTAVSDFVRQLKSSTSKHINENRRSAMKFHWQDGYGAFSVSMSKSALVVRYIDNQISHHRQLSFQDEFLRMLRDHEVDFDPRYVWE